MVLIIGPLLWVYVRQVTGLTKLPPFIFAANVIPALAIWLFNSPSVFRAAEEKVTMWNYVLDSSGGELPWFYIVLLLSIKAHLGIYLALSWHLISKLKLISNDLRVDNSKLVLTSMQFMVVAFFLLELLWVSLFVAQQFFGIGTLSSVGHIWLLFVGFMVLSIGYIGLQQPDLVFSHEEFKLVEHQTLPNSATETVNSNVKYLHSALPVTTGELLAKELESEIQKQQLYLNEKLTLTDLAKATDIKAHTLSQVINQSMKTNFYKLINSFRIQHAVNLIEDESINWPLERIAYESGFGNRVTFSKTFKEVMDCTPLAYKKKLVNVS